MPTSLLSTDTMFPNFKGNETTEEKVDQIQNYLYMLVEQLRYSMANIGAENFNETEFDNIVNLITEPIYFQLTSEDGTINQMLHVTEDRLISKIEGVTKGVEELGRTVTTIQQTVNSITLEATEDVNGNTSTITLTGNGIEARSVNISFKGEVTFEALENKGYVTTGTIDSALSGKGYVTTKALGDINDITTINGAYISTGVIDGVEYRAYGTGKCFVVKNDSGEEIGGIRYDYRNLDGLYGDKMYLYTKSRYDGFNLWRPSVKVESEGNVSIEAPEGLVYIKGVEYVTITDGIARWTFRNGGLFRNDTQVL